eukprot:CAMPEP_0171709662 /NCGR_PEP_ID=MMETSP0991-20121206/15584_1 /TAXON_ID=483369 /ORGANISM="non described non described, Strain CCMP2098" /LENGTH=339 /DNA_ID=CAMNT_0012299757 /DNA_START=92 /DNA_END=1111 /DNA_ORIENTATION=-
MTIVRSAVVQSLWSGYGSIIRLWLSGGDGVPTSVIAKRVQPPRDESGIGHERKCRSYVVEQCFYEKYAGLLNPGLCRVPQLLCSDHSVPGETLFILEDLDPVELGPGFGERRSRLDVQDARSCVVWLAQFHKTFLNKNVGLGSGSGGVWAQGTYWHLATRPDEHRGMDNRDPLKSEAGSIDKLLRTAKHQTLLHGDAKLANFCWRKREKQRGDASCVGAGGVATLGVAAVDFQYTGWGIGVLDLYYCLGAFPAVEDLPRNEAALLDLYFSVLDAGPEVEAEWRALYCVAVADFERFLAGWCGGGGSGKRRGHVGEKVNEAMSLIAAHNSGTGADIGGRS